MWNKYLHAKLTSIGFSQSSYDKDLYHHHKTIFAVYVDDGTFASPVVDNINMAINDLRNSHCDTKDQGSLSDSLEANIIKLQEEVLLSQPHLIMYQV